MKKLYSKPQIFIEQFTLSEHIAGTCGPYEAGQANYRDGGSCTFTDSDMTLFNTGNQACEEGMSQIEYDTLTFPTLNDFLLTTDCYNAFKSLGDSAFAS